MGYRDHGFNPSDETVAKEGFKAFPPRGTPLRPGDEREKALMERMGADAATGDPGELAGVAARLAALWPGSSPARFFAMTYGYDWDDDEDVPADDPGWLV